MNYSRNQKDSNRRDEQSEKLKAEGDKIFADFKTEWITQGFNKACSKSANDLGKFLVDGQMTRTQIRNFFGELRRIEARGAGNSAEQIRHLHHKLCYTKAKLDEQHVSPEVTTAFQKVLEKGLQAIPDPPEPIEAPFSRFVSYFEAVLAYHRYHGGREK
jgi:CRISPR-associated protein Csm2